MREGGERSEFFVTTKINCCTPDNADRPCVMGSDMPRQDIEHNLAVLGLEYVDLTLLHWPCPTFEGTLATWRALEDAVGRNQTRAIGIANADSELIERLVNEARVPPANIRLLRGVPYSDILKITHVNAVLRTLPRDAYFILADADELLREAENALRVDNNAVALLGPNIQIGSVFSTSSSSSNINGQVRKMIMLQCQCAGAAGNGMVAIRGESDGPNIQVASLQLQAGGQVINVPTLRGGGGGMGGGGRGGREHAAHPGPGQQAGDQE